MHLPLYGSEYSSNCGWKCREFESLQNIFSPGRLYTEYGVLGAQREGWDHTAELRPLHGYVFGGVERSYYLTSTAGSAIPVSRFGLAVKR